MGYQELDRAGYRCKLRVVIAGAEGMHSRAESLGDGKATIGWGHASMRVGRIVASILSLLCMAACASTSGASTQRAFSGTWSARICDEKSSRECGIYSLQLIERNGRICGRHYAATVGLGRLEEGLDEEGATIVGIVVEGDAVVVIRSVRNEAHYMAKMTRSGNALLWERVGQVDAGSMEESPVIPLKQTLMPDTGAQALALQREFEAAPCAWISEVE
jgi:hypothetical protein